MIYIKGMKTLAGIKIVKDELKKLKMKISFVGMGEVNIKGIFTSRLHDKLNKRLHKFDMSLLDTKEEKKLNSSTCRAAANSLLTLSMARSSWEQISASCARSCTLSS